jgi:agmatinase
VEAKKRIIGFDLNEVAPGNDEWDANVGARLLYNLVNYTALSQGKFKK